MGATVLSKIVLLGEEVIAAVTIDESQGMGAEAGPRRGKEGTKLEALEEDGSGILRLMEGMGKAAAEWGREGDGGVCQLLKTEVSIGTENVENTTEVVVVEVVSNPAVRRRVVGRSLGGSRTTRARTRWRPIDGVAGCDDTAGYESECWRMQLMKRAEGSVNLRDGVSVVRTRRAQRERRAEREVSRRHAVGYGLSLVNA